MTAAAFLPSTWHTSSSLFTRRRNRAAPGLGLAISESIVERHGGTIEVNSVVGQGTTFKILLPMDSQRPAIPVEAERRLSEVR